MKKISLCLILFSFSLLVGCTLGNTPTSRVENMLSKYQMLDNSINVSYTSFTTDTNLGKDIIGGYEKAIEKQYRNLSYEVKDEVIDGDTATVTIQIEVMNYKDVIDRYNKNDYELVRYHELVIEALKDTKDTITYTLDITLTKDNSDNWSIDTLTTENINKLLGIY